MAAIPNELIPFMEGSSMLTHLKCIDLLREASADADSMINRVYEYLGDLARRKDGFGEPLSKEENALYNLLIDLLSVEDDTDLTNQSIT